VVWILLISVNIKSSRRSVLENREEKVLIVDDDDSLRLVLQLMVEEIGYGVVGASNGVLGLEELARNGCNIVAAIVDINMPIMNGMELLEEIRVIRRDLPVILSSGNYNPDLEATLANHGMCSFLTKPYTFDCLKETLTGAIASVRRKPKKIMFLNYLYKIQVQ
jgi:DNA-binding NtrC family response regulator